MVDKARVKTLLKYVRTILDCALAVLMIIIGIGVIQIGILIGDPLLFLYFTDLQTAALMVIIVSGIWLIVRAVQKATVSVLESSSEEEY